MIDVKAVRQDFPILNGLMDGKALVYFDNACMSLRPRPVIEAITRYYTDLSACGGRSNHRLANRVTIAVDEAREKLAKFIGAKRNEEIIFTRNTTEGINLVANTLSLKAGDVVFTTDKEHNSNLIPWLKLASEKGIVHRVIESNQNNTFNLHKYKELLTPEVKLVSVVMTSNLDGVTNPIKEIAKEAHRVGAKVLVDGAQGVPHMKVNVKDLDIDFLAFSGHKMMGPSGMGVLYGKYELMDKLPGFLVGGDTVEYSTYTSYKHLPLPEKYEAGLQDYAGIIGLGEAVTYLTQVGWENIAEHERKLNTIITEGLAKEKRIKIIGPQDPWLRGGVVAFTVDGAEAHQLALMLDESSRIMVRSGQHCVHSWFEAKKIKGSVRVSIYLYNTEAEAEYLVENVIKILQVI